MGEPARLILAQAGVQYEDIRIEREAWLALKAKVPMGQLPMLEVDGKTICQSMAISRYCAKRFGLAGQNDLEAALADQAVDAVSDLVVEMIKVIYEQDEEKKAELQKVMKDEKVPVWLSMMEGVLKAMGGYHFTGSSLSWADIVVYNFVTNLKARVGDLALDSFPSLAGLVTMVGDLPNIKKWEETRPNTPM